MIKSAWRRVVKKLESPAALRRDRLAFMPAALEVQESPPSPIGRAILWSILVCFAIAVLWACFGRIDVVAVATGKIVPSDRVKVIQPLEKGMVVAIRVREDQRVSRGDPLVALDTTLTAADEARLASDFHEASMAWLRASAFQAALVASASEPVDDLALITTTAQSLAMRLDAPDRRLQAQLLRSQRRQYQSRLAALGGQYRARIGERHQVQALARKLERTLPLITERVQSLKTLYDQKLASREQFLALEQERIAQEQDLAAQNARLEALGGEIEAVQSQRATVQSEAMVNNLKALVESRRRARGLEQDYRKASQRNKQQLLHAPIDGYVKRLQIHTIGGVVTPAQELMQIVPRGENLEVEAYILNRDIGFVEEGQAAAVKIDTFNFTRFGTVDAHVQSIANDAVADENLGLVYPATVRLERSNIRVNGKWVNLSPGMAVTVEVKTGKRRIIEFFLSPLLRYKQESIRER